MAENINVRRDVKAMMKGVLLVM